MRNNCNRYDAAQTGRPQPQGLRSHKMRSSGFTLLEVLVALAIVSFGLSALFTVTNQTVRASSYLREKTFAQWIALNQIVETRLTNQVPTDEKTDGEVEYAGDTWRWELEVVPTPVDGIVRLEARAALSSAPKDSWPGQATGFMSTTTSTGTAAAIAPPTNNGQSWLQSGPRNPIRRGGPNPQDPPAAQPPR